MSDHRFTAAPTIGGKSVTAKWPKVHYAWVVVGVTFTTLLVAGGIRGSPGVFVIPLENEFHWSRATISLAVGINICVYGLIGPFAAALMESIGVRRTMLGALALVGAGALLTPLMQYPWQLMLLWGVIVGAGTGMTASVLAATVATRWFEAQRGFVVGLLTSAAAAGQLVFLPFLAGITVTFGWRFMALTAAAAAFCLIPVVALLMRERPQDMALGPYGAAADLPPKPLTGNPLSAAFAALHAGLCTRDYWLLGGSLFICGASTNGLIGTHLIPACVDHGIPEVTAASLLAGMAVLNFIGATSSGWLSDRIDPRLLLFMYYGLRGLSLVYLPFAFVSFYGLSLFAAFYGLDWIATIPATIRLTAGRFGQQRTGMMFGWLMVLHQVGGAIAAYLAGALRVDFGSYLQAFVLSGTLCLVAAIMVLFISREPMAPQVIVTPSPA